MGLLDTISGIEIAESHRPWPRVLVSGEGWQQAIDHLSAGRFALLGLWADPPTIHMGLFNGADGDAAIVSYACKSGKFPSVGAHHAPAIRLERAINDLFGLEALNATDTRPWLDLGFWNVRYPLGEKAAVRKQVPYKFLPAEGEGLHQIPVGPVHAGIIEPGHFRFSANGEYVVRLEQRLGVRPQSDLEGVLQDVHWAVGSFGYFPSYALGAVMAAQFYDAVRESVPVGGD